MNSISLILLMMSLFHMACRDVGGGPIKEDKGFPNHLRWALDTLSTGNEQSTLFGISGFSASDVYAVSYSSALFSGKMWYWNGATWTDLTSVYVEAFPGVQIAPWSPNAVWVDSGEDVWFVGSKEATNGAPGNGFIMRKSGSMWTGFWPPDARQLFAVWGTSATDVWVGGLDKYLRHFDGSTWTKHALPDSVAICCIWGLSSTDVYASGQITWTGAQADIRYYHWDGAKWYRIEQALENDATRKFGPTFAPYGGAIYSAVGSQISRRGGAGHWEIIHTLAGTTESSVMSVSTIGMIAKTYGSDQKEVVDYFDGLSWSRLPIPVPLHSFIGGVWSEGTTLFVLVNEIASSDSPWPKTLVLRGVP